MKKIILFLFLICSANLIFASTTSETIFHKINNFEEIQNPSDFYKREMSLTLTDECVRTWTITATCASCANYVLNDAIWEHWQKNLDNNGCFHNPDKPYLPE